MAVANPWQDHDNTCISKEFDPEDDIIWHEGYDDEHQMFFYYNSVTEESVWDKPDAPYLPHEPAESDSEIVEYEVVSPQQSSIKEEEEQTETDIETEKKETYLSTSLRKIVNLTCHIISQKTIFL